MALSKSARRKLRLALREAQPERITGAARHAIVMAALQEVEDEGMGDMK